MQAPRLTTLGRQQKPKKKYCRVNWQTLSRPSHVSYLSPAASASGELVEHLRRSAIMSVSLASIAGIHDGGSLYLES
jgi:hypothetical protein